jgi:hypothetical protein
MPFVSRRALPALLAVPILLAALALAVPPAQAQDAGAIRGVIESQLDAFRRDAKAEAFSYASPDIQRIFRNPDRFMQMVRSGYPQVYRPQAVEFQALKPVAEGRAIQEVFFVGPNGVGSLALYVMERQPDGTWKIDGVRLTELPDSTV